MKNPSTSTRVGGEPIKRVGRGERACNFDLPPTFFIVYTCDPTTFIYFFSSFKPSVFEFNLIGLRSLAFYVDGVNGNTACANNACSKNYQKFYIWAKG